MPVELSPAIPQLPSGNIEETAQFFKESLGFEVVSLMKDFNFLIVRRGPAEIHFWQASSKEEALQVGSASSCYVRVKTFLLFMKSLKAERRFFVMNSRKCLGACMRCKLMIRTGMRLGLVK